MADLSQSVVASLSRALNAAKVPCVLWGHCLLGLHGVLSIIGASTLTPINYSKADRKLTLRQVDRLRHSR